MIEPSRRRTRLGRAVAVLAALAAATAATTPALASPGAAATPAKATTALKSPPPKPGATGSPIRLAHAVSLSDGYDIGTDAAGTAYVGWISTPVTGDGDKTVSLCTLPAGATACSGGILSTSALDKGTAAGLKVLVTPNGQVTLVWYHDQLPDAVEGPSGGRLAIATSIQGSTLSPGVDVAAGPSHGTLLDAKRSPDGRLWTVVQSAYTDPLQVGPVGVAPALLTTPFDVGFAEIAFSGGTPVLAIQKAGSITVAPAYATAPGGNWTGFTSLANTWTGGSQVGLGAGGSGVRLVTSQPDADYHPVISALNGATFGPSHLTGDSSTCGANSHDLVSDASGRIADVNDPCDDALVLSNFADDSHAAIVKYRLNGTPAGGEPRIATTPRGRAWVVWSMETGSEGDDLFVAPFLLPGLATKVTHRGLGGSVTVTGPVSCLPPVGIAVGVSARPARQWTLVSKVLLRGTAVQSSVLDGSRLTPGSKYALTGVAVFARGGVRRVVTTRLSFTSCRRP